MAEYIDVHNIDTDHLLNTSNVFCMFPWTHLNTTPKGDIYPCCSNDYTDPVGNTSSLTLTEAFNTEKMRKLRNNMLSDKPSKICNFCYDHEKNTSHSFRRYSLEHFGKYLPESLAQTHTSGAVDEFKMRYYDIRFSNICNFKCRTCGTEFSSQWALEDRKTGLNPDGPVIIHVDDNRGDVLTEVLEQIDNIDLAYFAGGEPLITPEHYVILEELIRAGKTDTTLRYNTNASNLNYKDKDILDLWSNFDRVEVSCSVDTWGDRAEILRNGTDWGKIENNLKIIRRQPNVDFQDNTVLSIFNYQTLVEFYNYMKLNGLINLQKEWHHTLYLAVNPDYYCAKALPQSLKTPVADKIHRHYRTPKTSVVARLLSEAQTFTNSDHTWDQQRENFWHHTTRINDIRSEDLFKSFPELQPLADL